MTAKKARPKLREELRCNVPHSGYNADCDLKSDHEGSWHEGFSEIKGRRVKWPRHDDGLDTLRGLMSIFY